MRFWLAWMASLCLAAETVAYLIEPGRGDRFALKVEKTGLMSGKKHLFLFERCRGRLHYDAAAPERSSGELVVESASIACKDTWVKPKELVKIQRAAVEDMLAAQLYPEVIFRSTGAMRKPEGGCEVRGNLTIRDRTMPVAVAVFPETGRGGELRFRGHAVVRLRDYGLKPPSTLLGAIGTKNEVRLGFVVTARPQR
ncbi:MAG: YceI family protein [Bryobacterales bacterium]|nr:YceI family protein [Bryobacteraceae bacterium]MDW8354323.1 YceI family protein [Bryobacterales bacterium]